VANLSKLEIVINLLVSFLVTLRSLYSYLLYPVFCQTAVWLNWGCIILKSLQSAYHHMASNKNALFHLHVGGWERSLIYCIDEFFSRCAILSTCSRESNRLHCIGLTLLYMLLANYTIGLGYMRIRECDKHGWTLRFVLLDGDHSKNSWRGDRRHGIAFAISVTFHF
jgi:hypothetical protein